MILIIFEQYQDTCNNNERWRQISQNGEVMPRITSLKKNGPKY